MYYTNSEKHLVSQIMVIQTEAFPVLDNMAVIGTAVQTLLPTRRAV